MAGETPITVIGNLTADPEIRYTAGGDPVANFTVASTPRTFDRQSNEWKDGEAMFLRVSLWKDAALNAAESLTKGMRVIVSGGLVSRAFEDRDGNKRTSFEVKDAEVGPSLKWATARVARSQQGGGSGNASQGGGFGGGFGAQQGGGFGGQPQQGQQPPQGGAWGQPAPQGHQGPPAPQNGAQPPQGGGFGGPPAQGQQTAAFGGPTGPTQSPGNDPWTGQGAQSGGWDTPSAGEPRF